MFPKKDSQKGQALVLIALGIVVLLGFIGLAIDGGMIYADRRQAQNAADAAAMAAAQSKCAGGSFSSMTTAATTAATTNGFTGNGGTTQVTVNNPPQSGTFAGSSNYIEVVISSKTQPIFTGVFNASGVTNTVRAVSHCTNNGGGSGTQPGVTGDIALLALNPTASSAIENTGGSNNELDVDGGVFVNSTASTLPIQGGGCTTNYAIYQSGSAVFKMNWLKVRGGAALQGAVGTYAGANTDTKEIDIAQDVCASGNGAFTAGAFNVGGTVRNGNSVTWTPTTVNVGGNYYQDGAGKITASPLLIVGNVVNSNGGSIYSTNMTVGGNVTESGGVYIAPPTGQNQILNVKGNVSIASGATIGTSSSDQLFVQGTLTGACPPLNKCGTTLNSSITSGATVTVPSFSVSIPAMSDPLASLLNPPTPPTGTCTSLSLPNYGSSTLALTSGGYYCNINVTGSFNATIPPGTYWVDYMAVTGGSSAVMNGVHLYTTGKNTISCNGVNASFCVGNGGKITMTGTMLYLQSGAFSISGAAATQNWTAPGSGDIYQGLGLYMDRANSSSASLDGSAATSLSGTWYAPASLCTFTGATSVVVNSQFICDKIKLTGSSALKIKYDSTLVYQIPVTGSSHDVGLDQ